MLPQLKKWNESSPSAASRAPAEKKEEFDLFALAMSEFHDALMARDYKKAGQIFKSLTDLADASPHIEGPHTKE